MDGHYINEHIFKPLDMRNSFMSQKQAKQSGMGGKRIPPLFRLVSSIRIALFRAFVAFWLYPFRVQRTLPTI